MGTGRFEGKRMFITGVASGVGAEAVEYFAAEGARVVGVDITEGDGIVRCDISDKQSVVKAMGIATEQLGGLDVCVNIAATGHFSSIDDMALDAWNRVLAVNLTGSMLVTQAALPHLRASTGNVVTVASISGLQGQPFLSAYCASKAGLLHLMKCLAVELASSGVRVNCVCPGGIGPMPDAGEATAILPDGVDPMQFIRLNATMPGIIERSDVVEAIAWLASDAARSVSGAALVVDRVTLW